MQQQSFQNRRTPLRAGLWALVAVSGLLAAGAASYAATDGWTEWPWSLNITLNGEITDQDGNVIGESVVNEDGTIDAFMNINGQESHLEITPVNPEEIPPGGSLHFEVVP